MSIVPHSVAEHHHKGSGTIPLAPAFICINEIPSQSFPDWTGPVHTVSPHKKHSPVPTSSLWPSSGPSPVTPYLLVLREPRTGHNRAEERERITSLNLLTTLFPKHPRIQLALLATNLQKRNLSFLIHDYLRLVPLWMPQASWDSLCC